MVKEESKKKKCRNCELDFTPPYRGCAFCHDICREQHKIKELNQKWAKKDYKPLKPTAEAIRKLGSFGQYYDEPENLKKYTACRG